MRFASLRVGDRVVSAVERDGRFVDLGTLAGRLGLGGGPFPVGCALVAAWEAGNDRVLRTAWTAREAEPASLPFVEPDGFAPAIPDTRQVLAVGMNYRQHCREQGREPPPDPVFFTKLASCLSGHGEPIVHWPVTREPDYEGELAVVIGRGGRGIPEATALEHCFGYTVMNDVTARDLQRSDRQWTRSKGLDTFGPLGPVVVTRDEIPDPQALRIRTFVNDEPRQDSGTDDMAFTVARVVTFASEAITLRPGDVIATGTPSGVGVFADPPVFLKAGDVVRIEITGIGVLENRVEPGKPACMK
jgi:2-keto-4-pentenoate hydratase/2-oxohepta-3-ene-1,7-dioic acid hydratase in catechol pathway